MKRLIIELLLYLLKQEVEMMAVIYSTLIIKGKKTFEQVPDRLKPQVKQILIDLEVPELVE